MRITNNAKDIGEHIALKHEHWYILQLFKECLYYLVRIKKYIESNVIRFLSQVKLGIFLKKWNYELHFDTCFNQRKVEIKKRREEEGMNTETGIENRESMKEEAVVLSGGKDTQLHTSREKSSLFKIWEVFLSFQVQS